MLVTNRHACELAVGALERRWLQTYLRILVGESPTYAVENFLTRTVLPVFFPGKNM